MKKSVLAILLMTAMFGCSSESTAPDELIDEQTYKKMFMEFTIINQLDERLLQKESRDELRDMVYEHYKVTKDEFRISHEYYEQQVDQQLERVEEMSEIFRTERDSVLSIEQEYKKLTTPEQVDSLRQVLRRNE